MSADKTNPYFTLHRILAVVNIGILLILTTDYFLLPKTHVREVYDHRYSVDTRGRYTANTYATDYIVTKSRDEFQVPTDWQYTNIGLNNGDTFYIDETRLLGEPTTLWFRWKDGMVPMHMSLFNNGYWGPILAIFILIVSLLQLPIKQIIPGDNVNERLIFIGTALLAVFLFFLFYH